jgi:hypothetical protein
MFAMGASAVFASDVGSVSLDMTLKRPMTQAKYCTVGRQLSSQLRGQCLGLVAVVEQMESLLENEHPRHH